jgi:hypothetical protein
VKIAKSMTITVVMKILHLTLSMFRILILLYNFHIYSKDHILEEKTDKQLAQALVLNVSFTD